MSGDAGYDKPSPRKKYTLEIEAEVPLEYNSLFVILAGQDYFSSVNQGIQSMLFYTSISVRLQRGRNFVAPIVIVK